jgi:glycosyltransferase involved in cell wall biosynthesis
VKSFTIRCDLVRPRQCPFIGYEMKILFLDDGVFEEEPGGSRLVSRELGRKLCDAGHEVTFLVPAHSSTSPVRERRGSLHIRRYPRSEKSLRLIYTGYRAALQLWSETRFDIVHSHFAFASVGPAWAVPQTVPCIRTFHGPWDQEALSSSRVSGVLSSSSSRLKAKLQRRIELLSLRQAERVVVLSDHFASMLAKQYGQAVGRIEKVPGGVDSIRFAPATNRATVRSELGLPADRRILLSVRRLVPRMGLHNLILAMPSVLGQSPTALLLIGGRGPERQSLEELTRSLNLGDAVRFLDFIPERRLPKYYQAADLFVLPSLELEGFGLVTLEALSSGLPVVGTPTGATPEILMQLEPRLLAKGVDPGAIGDAIVSVLQTGLVDQLNPHFLADWVRERFSWTDHSRRVEAIYRAALGRHSKLGGESPAANGRRRWFARTERLS